MKKKDLAQLREQTIQELKDQISKLQQEVMDLRMQFHLKKLKDVHAMKKKYKDIARIKTILKERELKEGLEQ